MKNDNSTKQSNASKPMLCDVVTSLCIVVDNFTKINYPRYIRFPIPNLKLVDAIQYFKYNNNDNIEGYIHGFIPLNSDDSVSCDTVII